MSTKQLWQWRGMDKQGMPCEGTLWQETRGQALASLEQQQILLLTLRRQTVQGSLWRPRYSSEIIRQLATLLQAGLPLAEGLELLAQQQPHKQWQALLRVLAQELANGVSLSSGLAQWPQVFPPLYLAMIRTGELTGKLERCCFQLALQQQEQQRLTEKVKKALRYPMVILTLALAVVIAMLFFVLPEMVIHIGDALARYWPLLPPLFAIPLSLNRLARHRPRWLLLRQKLLHAIPIAGRLINGQQLSQIFTILSLTQSAGISFVQGLESVEETMGCPLWRQRIAQARADIIHGQPIWQALTNCGGFTLLCLQLIRTGEASGALDTMLDNLARHHSEQTHQQADNLATLLEPLLLAVTGTIVGVLVVAMYLPIFHLGDALGGMGS